MESIKESNKNTLSTTSPNGKKWSLVALVLVVLLGVGIIGGYLWYQGKSQSYEKELAALEATQSDNEAQLADLKTENELLKKNNTTAPQQDPAPVSEDEKVFAAAKNYCNALVNPTTKEAMKFTLGTMAGKKIVYSEGKNFAKLNVACHYANGSPNGFARSYVLKKVNDTWIVIVTTTQQLDASEIANFAIPSSMSE